MKPASRGSSTGYRIALIILFITNLVALAWIARPLLEERGIRLPFPQIGQVLSAATTPTRTATPSSPQPTGTSIPILLQNTGTPAENLRAQGVLILAMRDGNYSRLFAYHPLYLPLTRLTGEQWDDITPSLSPDGARLAYASHENGYWNLVILDLASGKKTRVTSTPEYKGSPTWSPDGQWMAYEAYNGTSLDIYIRSLTDPAAAPIQLTEDPGIDRSPAWSPSGREIAFVSSRTGDEEIWLARLDKIDDRFVNVSNNPRSSDLYPAWSADGSKLAWASDEEGQRQIAVWESGQFDRSPQRFGSGELPAWIPDGSVLFCETQDTNQAGLSAYAPATGRLALPYTPLPGKTYGLAWVKGPLPGWLDKAIASPDQKPAPPLWQPALTRTVLPEGRAALITLDDVAAPQPMLQDAVDEAFVALRKQVAVETGWDALSSLENAYVPLTSPPIPSIEDDWLYTGRAFSVNPLLVSASWMAVAREDFGGQTYWRVYLKARYQDGTMGKPLTGMVWDFNARYSGDPRAYEQGGQAGQAPGGYWIDLTEIAGRFGWERLPSWINWRTFFPSIRFNQFVMTGGLEWHQAMAQLYPPEALATLTPLPSITPTLTPTLKPTPAPPTETPLPSSTPTPTLRPTVTPDSNTR